MPVEAIIFLFFLLVLGPLISIAAYCGVRGTCSENEEEEEDKIIKGNA